MAKRSAAAILKTFEVEVYNVAMVEVRREYARLEAAGAPPWDGAAWALNRALNEVHRWLRARAAGDWEDGLDLDAEGTIIDHWARQDGGEAQHCAQDAHRAPVRGDPGAHDAEAG